MGEYDYIREESELKQFCVILTENNSYIFKGYFVTENNLFTKFLDIEGKLHCFYNRYIISITEIEIKPI
jgi:hypothetical protein